MELRKPFDDDFPITQRFGENTSTYRNFGLSGHNGVDYALPERTPILAAGDGVVLEADVSPNGYGLYVKIQHQDDLVTLYGHLSRAVVRRQQAVEAGDIIGYSGNTGNSTGPHLHFEVRDKRFADNGYRGGIDPLQFLGGDPDTTTGRKVVIAEQLNMRAGPSTNDAIFARLLDGTLVEVLEVDGVWRRVTVEGWVHGDFLK